MTDTSGDGTWTPPAGARVCVIGAGVAGLVTAKVLRHDGFEVTVFEKEPTIGGVWAASRTYPGLRTNNPRETYAYSDFPYPETADDFPTAEQVREYLGAYADHFELRPHLRLSTEVVSVSRTPDGDKSGPRFRVTVRPTNAPADTDALPFDFVAVCNGVFSEPFLPHLDGRQRFVGTVAHSSGIPAPEALEGKRVVVVGAGKSALDCAAHAARRSASCTLVFRTPHWMLPRYLFGGIRIDRILYTRFAEMLLPPYHRATRAEAFLHRWGAPLVRLWWRMQSWLVPRLCRMPRAMVPDTPLPSQIETIGIGEEFYRALRGEPLHVRRARIVRFSGPDTMELDTGEHVVADIVVFATGWRQIVSLLDADLQHAVQDGGQFHLYRNILPPTERRLGFVGYASSSACPFTSEIAAHWLSQCFRGELELPEIGEMEKEIARIRRWIAEVFPARREGYFIGAYIAHYADELMCDMGLPARRTGNVFAEYFAPFWPRRYRALANERERGRRRAACTRRTALGYRPQR